MQEPDRYTSYHQTPAVLTHYPNVPVQLDAPGLAGGRNDFTNPRELEDFVAALAKFSRRIVVGSLGKSQQGREIPISSQFRAEFEVACKATQTSRAQRAVERARGSWRYEFYACYDLPFHSDELQLRVDAFAHRSHDALDGLTSAEYLRALSVAAPPSHMC